MVLSCKNITLYLTREKATWLIGFERKFMQHNHNNLLADFHLDLLYLRQQILDWSVGQISVQLIIILSSLQEFRAWL
ncbi:hypothetical protein VIGAN_05067400, partial [Vigna angularis var. angularis]